MRYCLLMHYEEGSSVGLTDEDMAPAKAAFAAYAADLTAAGVLIGADVLDVSALSADSGPVAAAITAATGESYGRPLALLAAPRRSTRCQTRLITFPRSWSICCRANLKCSASRPCYALRRHAVPAGVTTTDASLRRTSRIRPGGTARSSSGARRYSPAPTDEPVPGAASTRRPSSPCTPVGSSAASARSAPSAPCAARRSR
jgi:hypothetical protein